MASSCHPSHCKTSIPFSQALRLNQICSEPHDFDKRCNDLDAWLIKRGYDERLVRNKVLAARKYSRRDLLNRVKSDSTYKITLNVTFNPAYQNLNRLSRKLHVILTCDSDHKKAFKDIPVVGFRRGKSLRDFLMRAKVPQLEVEQGVSKGCLKSN